MWDIDYYETSLGRCPTLEFIKEQNPNTEQPYLFQAIDLLEEFGNLLEYPQVKIIGNGLYELRIKIRTSQFRFFYFFFEKDIIVITHGFKKQYREATHDQIPVAEKYRKDYLKRKK